MEKSPITPCFLAGLFRAALARARRERTNAQTRADAEETSDGMRGLGFAFLFGQFARFFRGASLSEATLSPPCARFRSSIYYINRAPDFAAAFI